MPGATFVLGEQKVRPDVYVRWHNAGGARIVTGTVGVAAAVVKSNWGPLGEVITIEAGNVAEKLGSGYGPDTVNEIFIGGASTVLAVRVGTGGSQAKLELDNAVDPAVKVVRLLTKYPTTRRLTVTIRDTLEDPASRELLLHEETRQLERLLFTKGANEAAHLVEAVNSGSKFLTAIKLADGSELDELLDVPLKDGADPTVTGIDYADAFVLLERKFFDTITVDSEDVGVHASLHSFVKRMLSEGGGRLIGVVGEPTSVAFESRKQNAKAFNDFAMVYVGNGFSTASGKLEGAKAAARVAGVIASSAYNASLTHVPMTGSIGVIGELTNAQYKEAILSGMLTFSLNPDGLAQIDYGINTKVTLLADEDEGWKKIRRTRTRYELIDRIILTLHPYLGNWTNNDDGRAFVITIANGIIQMMIREGGLESGQLIVDPDSPPQGDSAWFRFTDLVDLDSIEKLYMDFGFQFSPQTA
ncbi:MAG: phage tail sheath subtilisin-like domain-containing protein [Paenibacillus macerans]|uniref:phage tail sheath subtilisin-like domain-containing protein n=1 Tax=Paenibacillus macerans TaxID=44252 RepID=UPI001F115662|nr:phage tail sheath subtilisin-like domain-containing protein [Paenibacillus macerans]MDU5945461.1 phage tail sheath subtilisin-like domain-containing protein [Paenibacillus macerans]MDU7473624.1 phage tail sheath subtilisin-like domain-containing protein [Paenibacillus macerans]MEC0139208.1 phage tail sheath subtilisin-like domain-containing protein [Paenibacillus macerans]UMV47289.1 phage tail sheath subtilisin-like domain-containing protein [Paenibacillus macerans]